MTIGRDAGFHDRQAKPERLTGRDGRAFAVAVPEDVAAILVEEVYGIEEHSRGGRIDEVLTDEWLVDGPVQIAHRVVPGGVILVRIPKPAEVGLHRGFRRANRE